MLQCNNNAYQQVVNNGINGTRHNTMVNNATGHTAQQRATTSW